jgi:short-subunit dehydrogenase
VGVFGLTDYCASKFAVMGFSEALRAELASCGVGVSVLCPPDTDTPGFEIENRSKPAETRAVSEGAGLMTADAVAAALLAGLARGERVIVPGRDGKLVWWTKRLAPSLLERFMNRTIRRSLSR